MKVTTVMLVLAILLNSCAKKDKINHYLNEKVTELELVENGFFKYTFKYTITEKDDVNGPIGTSLKYDLYTNLKPQMQDDGKFYPVAIFGRRANLKNIAYLKNELGDRIITYYFVNNTLRSKYIYVYSIDKNNKKIADFTSEKAIINYYKNQIIPFKQRLGGIKYGKNKIEFPYRFRINNFESGIYILNDSGNLGYQMVTTYQDVKENEKTDYDFEPMNPDNVQRWYNGNTYELSK